MADTVQLLIRDPGAMAAEGLLLENRKEKELVKKVVSRATARLFCHIPVQVL